MLRLTTLVLVLTFVIDTAAESSVALRSRDEAFARQLFADVISMDTSVIKAETPRMVAYLSRHLQDAGFRANEIIEVPFDSGMASLIIKYTGSSPEKEAIGFMAHLDVVTAFRKDWELDPFTLTEHDGYFIGRGTADNKAGVVGLTATFIKLKKAGYIPGRTLYLIFTSDEETGMVSTQHIAQNLSHSLNIEYAINSDAFSGNLTRDGQPLGYNVQSAEKGYRSYTLTVSNPGGHSSAPRDDNAIYQLANALLKIEKYRFPTMINEISAGMLRSAAASSNQVTADAINRLLLDPTDLEATEVIISDPLLTTVIRTTCVATMLEAGHAENALPQSASATVNCRIMPAMSTDDVYERLTRIIDDSGVKISVIDEGNIGPASPIREDVMAALSDALQEYPGVELIPFMASYGTDGKEFRLVGTPVYGSSGIFMDPSEAYAHGLNEKIPVKTFYASLAYWERLMKKLASNPVM